MRKRILFVDDDSLLSQMYLMMLEADQDRWEATAVSQASEALRLMDKTPFDVVISDMRMPGMSGIELMKVIRQLHPRCSRVIVSGVDDQAEIARGLDSTHQFLAKPFDARTLRATLARLCSLDNYLQDEKLQALVGQMPVLPTFPSIYHEIMKELGKDDPLIERLAQIIAQDPSMTAKLLQIANSAASGRAAKAADLFEAVQFVGLSAVRSLALSAHIFRTFEHLKAAEFSLVNLWDHCVRTGLIAQRIMRLEQADRADTEEAHIAGMLHDLGKLMLADSLPEKFHHALILAGERGLSAEKAEFEIFRADHAGVAAYLLSLWGLPAAMVEAVAFHHAPSSSECLEFGPLTAVHVANVLDHQISAESSGAPLPAFDRSYLAAVGVRHRIEYWRTAISEELSTKDHD